MNRSICCGLWILAAMVFIAGVSACGGGGGGDSASGSGLVIELTWSTPSDPNETDTDGTDFNLHLRDENASGWFDSSSGPGSGCYIENPNPDWGVASDTSDDPLLVQEDDDGAGPEIIAISQPSVGMTYTVGVHSYADNGFESSFVTIDVYVDDVQVYQQANEEMVQGKVWEVVYIGWTDSGPVFQTIDVQVGD